MIQRTENTGKKKYVSCIKINGVPILPPLITSEKQKSLLRYKQQAIKLEKRLKREQELRTYITKYYLGELTNDDDDANSTCIINTLEQQLSFGDMKTADNVNDDVPCVKQKNKASKLSCDLQVSQYINNEFALLKHSSRDCDTLRANSVVINLAEDYIEKDHADDNELNTSSSKANSPKPRLIRSNSFTIESPSPILLERLNRDFTVQQITGDKAEAGDTLNDSNILLETERSSYDNNDGYTTCGSNCCLISGKEDGDEEKMNVESTSSRKSEAGEYFHEHNNKSVVSCIDLSETGSDLLEGKDVLEEQLPSNSDLNVLSSDFRFKEFISNNIPHTNIKSFPSEESVKKEDVFSDNESEPSNRNKEAKESKESSFTEADVELKLKHMLDNILQMHSKEILELLQVQQHEQELRLDKYQTVKQALLDRSVPALKCDENNSQDSQTHNSFWRETKCDTKNSSSTFEIVNPSFVASDKTENERVNLRSKATTKEERAATVIGARVKGYLTRRLLRTDKVQGLIQTIKDTLICAVQLHTETTEEINESDVELHRRLIQQVSAACYAFHDVFFSLSVKEQMSIIKLDRQKQKEKLLRGTNVRTSDRSKPQSARKFSNHK